MEQQEGLVEEESEGHADHYHANSEDPRAGRGGPPERAPQAASHAGNDQQDGREQGHEAQAHQDLANVGHVASFARVQDRLAV